MTYRLSLITTVLIGIQMVLGGVVVGQDAPFICPDWPLCGAALPTLTTPVLVEVIHRVTAFLVAVMVIAVTVRIWRKERQNRVLMAASAASVVSIVLQMVLAGLIVVLRLPGVVTTIDVMNGMFLMGLYVVLTTEAQRLSVFRRTGDEGRSKERSQMASTAWRVLAFGGLAVLMGALFRHTGASEAMFGMNHYLAGHGQYTTPSMAASVGMLVVHLFTAALSVLAALWLFVRAIQLKQFVAAASIVLALVGLQMVLGVVTLTSRLSFVVATLHWSNAAALIAAMTFVAARAQVARQPWSGESGTDMGVIDIANASCVPSTET